MYRLLPLLTLPTLVSGCTTLNEDNAPEVLAKATCKKDRKCRPDEFQDLYDNDLDECVVPRENLYEGLLDAAQFLGFELDVKEARSCLSDVRTASCDDYVDGDFSNDCDDVLGF